MPTIIPEDYQSILNLYETQDAIGMIKTVFLDELSDALNLKRVSAPLFVEPFSGLNDDLSGVERPVSFDIPFVKQNAQVVHSLAKWKRLALWQYDFFPGKGLWTDMNAIRRDEHCDNLHSVYVDQWDWEKVILPSERNEMILKTTVETIARCIGITSRRLRRKYPELPEIPVGPVTFISSEELETMYPNLSPEERENEFTKTHPIIFVSHIGWPLKIGTPHSLRAPDYDDWSLNGDLIYRHDILNRALEISSMGIRVDSDTLDLQLKAADCEHRKNLPFHKLLLDNTLPQTMGGGIGQSRLCMLLLGKCHIGEVQSSIWDEQTVSVCKDKGVVLL